MNCVLCTVVNILLHVLHCFNNVETWLNLLHTFDKKEHENSTHCKHNELQYILCNMLLCFTFYAIYYYALYSIQYITMLYILCNIFYAFYSLITLSKRNNNNLKLVVHILEKGTFVSLY